MVGEGEDIPPTSQFTSDEKFDSGCAADVRSSERDIEPGIPGSASNSSWATSSTSEEDVKSEGPYHIIVSPEHYNLDLPFRNVSRSKLIYSSLMRSPPRKLVPIGPDFQAELPDFVEHKKKKKACYSEETCKVDIISQALESDSDGHINEDRLAGTCIIPMPNLESAGFNDECVGNGSGSGYCHCEDAGSIRCIRQHVFEAREKLKIVLGEETFVKLGFYDMGEVVGLRWSEEEQEIFHDIVFSNPASVGRNFWNHLTVEFPSRTMKQIVSYYFNVFMLRRRAEQNRFDPLNVDSDNDEWHAPEESSGDEAKMTDEDEDSVVESPVYLDGHGLNEIYRDDGQAYDDVRLPIWEDYKDISDETNKADNFFSDKVFDKCSSEPTTRNEDTDFPNEVGHENGNCTSVSPKAPPHVKSDIGKDWPRSFVGMGSDNSHDFVLEPCSAKEWDFYSCPKSKVDLLPTCTMIEEVFGDKDWNYSSRDGHGSS